MSVAIRELGLGDTMLLEELLDACQPGWNDGLRPGASGPTAFTADPNTFVFGAYVDSPSSGPRSAGRDPAGWLWGVHIRRPDGRRMSYVHQLDVAEAYRRRGIATSLIEAATSVARAAGSHRLWLVTRMTNTGAQALYRSLGGTVWESGEGEVGDLVFSWPLD